MVGASLPHFRGCLCDVSAAAEFRIRDAGPSDGSGSAGGASPVAVAAATPLGISKGWHVRLAVDEGVYLQQMLLDMRVVVELQYYRPFGVVIESGVVHSVVEFLACFAVGCVQSTLGDDAGGRDGAGSFNRWDRSRAA